MAQKLERKCLYMLEWAWWEDYEYYLLEGPCMSEEEWRRRLSEAARAAIEELLKEEGYISMPEIVAWMTEKLEAMGFKEVSPPKLRLWGHIVLEKPEVEQLRELVGEELANKVLEHNKARQRELWEHLAKSGVFIKER